MKTFVTRIFIAIGVLGCLTAPALAQQPPDVVNSDKFDNTAMGTGALLHLDGAASSPGAFNTAAGYWALYSNTTGIANTAAGYWALKSNTTGQSNTAVGEFALQGNTTGFSNVAVGDLTLAVNTIGVGNSAFGSSALYNNTVGNENSAIGGDALFNNATGSNNTAVGTESMRNNSTGSNNTAVGFQALFSYFNNATGMPSATTGSNNTVSGASAMLQNTTGSYNTVAGSAALYSNTTGTGNTSLGYETLQRNVGGANNTAVGARALWMNVGQNNIGVGWESGLDLTTGSNNIDIGNIGVAAESGVVRVGTNGTHTATFIAGIANSHITGAAVFVTTSGQLGVLASSERYKTQINGMGAQSAALAQLRPVSFHLTSEPGGSLQYGLIAEEVAKVYPELVIRNADGQVEGVRYDELGPMLLNEVQRQQKQIVDQSETIARLQRELANLQTSIAAQIGALSQQFIDMQQHIAISEEKTNSIAEVNENRPADPSPGKLLTAGGL